MKAYADAAAAAGTAPRAYSHTADIPALVASKCGGSPHAFVRLPQYFGGVNRILAGQGQMRQIAGGFMNGTVARGAQVLGFKVHLNLHLPRNCSPTW